MKKCKFDALPDPGSTRYCVDKNYAGVLIIWDRMFGTFEPERRDEPLVYGLIEQVDSFNPFYLEVIIAIYYFKINSV
jgi:alkylglycerol monooxygenase